MWTGLGTAASGRCFGARSDLPLRTAYRRGVWVGGDAGTRVATWVGGGAVGADWMGESAIP